MWQRRRLATAATDAAVHVRVCTACAAGGDCATVNAPVAANAACRTRTGRGRSERRKRDRRRAVRAVVHGDVRRY